MDTNRKKTGVEDEVYDKITIKDNQGQDCSDTVKIKVHMDRGLNKMFMDKLRQLFIDHKMERTSSYDRIVSSYQNQIAMLDKELISKCDEVKTRYLAAMATLKQELSQEVWEQEHTPSQPVKTEYIEYEFKQECL